MKVKSQEDPTAATVSLLDSDGQFLWGPNPIQYVGQPIVGNMDGDDELEIFMIECCTVLVEQSMMSSLLSFA